MDINNDPATEYRNKLTERFTDAVRLMCGTVPPADLVKDWLHKSFTVYSVTEIEDQGSSPVLDIIHHEKDIDQVSEKNEYGLIQHEDLQSWISEMNLPKWTLGFYALEAAEAWAHASLSGVHTCNSL